MHEFIPMPQAMKIPDAKAAVDREWKKLETIPAWELKKVTSKKEVILEAHPGMAADGSQKQKKRWSLKQGKNAKKYILCR